MPKTAAWHDSAGRRNAVFAALKPPSRDDLHAGRVPPAEVGVYLDGQEIGRFVPDEAWQIFPFSGHARPTSGRSTLAFKTSTFNPAQMQISGDARDLGFLLDSLRSPRLSEPR
jgi:hypothetical protein